MADLKKTVEIIFQGKDDVSDDVQNIKKVIDSLDDDINIGLDIDDDGGLSGLTPKISAIKIAFGEAGVSAKDFNKAINSVTNTASSVASSVTSLITGVLALEAGFAALATGGLVYAISEAGAFTASMSEVYSLLDIGPTQFKNLKESVIDYAKGSTQPLESITTALYNTISLGIDYTDAIDAIAVSEKLAVGGKTDLNSATELLIGTLNAYGKNMD